MEVKWLQERLPSQNKIKQNTVERQTLNHDDIKSN